MRPKKPETVTKKDRMPLSQVHRSFLLTSDPENRKPFYHAFSNTFWMASFSACFGIAPCAI